ncbi:hypothetical protein PB2503_09584 [Parvularcula bermudensis HTCC2503]|uniref:Uncharacterized protein n=1 Tax=Parvularcula bermudensis (strain ATCC BAA-594 / HTCC2503 / KCTC 12087) TaxID=314260 RepID=E0TDE6_PARBH|nr:hypothetical protein PB2503_09584 [Parvularcula bermudensis HTCC2503]
MKFAIFIGFLVLFTLGLLYVVGDRRVPAQSLVEKEVELTAR